MATASGTETEQHLRLLLRRRWNSNVLTRMLQRQLDTQQHVRVNGTTAYSLEYSVHFTF